MSPPQASREPSAPSLSKRLLDRLFGYDYFLAHRSVDGKPYAAALFDALTHKSNGLDCFLDVRHYGAGGETLTAMQSRALRKTTRLIVIVTPQADGPEEGYLHREVREFRKLHPEGVIVPIGTHRTLVGEGNPGSLLLPLLPRYPETICILETEEALLGGAPSSATIKKLLNDFNEERGSARRLRWIQRAAAVLLLMLIATGILALMAYRSAGTAREEKAKAVRSATQADLRRADVSLQLARQEQAESGKSSPLASSWHLLEAAAILEGAGGKEQARTALHAAGFAAGPLRATRIHGGWIDEVKVAPGGGRFATSSIDGIVRVWDAADLSQIGPAIRKEGSGMATAFSPDGSLVTVSGGGGDFGLWDAATGQSVPLAAAADQGAEPVAGEDIEPAEEPFTADGKTLITRVYRGGFSLWDARTGRWERSFAEDMEDDIPRITASPRGDRIIGVTDMGVVRLWDRRSGGLLRSADLLEEAAAGPEGEDQGIAPAPPPGDGQDPGDSPPDPLDSIQAGFSPDGAHAFIRAGRIVRLWDSAGAGDAGPAITLGAEPLQLGFTPDGKRFRAITADHLMKEWDSATAAPASGLSQLPSAPATLRDASAIFRHLLCAAGDGLSLRLWNITDGTPRGSAMPHEHSIGRLAFSPGGDRILSVDWKTVRLWDGRNGSRITSLRHDAPVKEATFSPDGKLLLTVAEDGMMLLWDARDGFRAGLPFTHQDSIVAAMFTPDGRGVVSCSGDGTIRLWSTDPASGGGVVSRRVASGEKFSFSPDGHRLMSWGGGFSARLRDASSFQPIGSAMAAPLDDEPLISPDGGKILTRSAPSQVSVWDAATGKRIGAPIRTGVLPGSFTFSPDGLRLVWHEGKRLRRWSADTGKEEEVPTEDAGIQGVAWIAGSGTFLEETEQASGGLRLSVARIRDGRTGEPLGPVMESGEFRPSRIISPDGTRMAIWGAADRIQLWDLRTGTPVCPPMPVETWVRQAVFSRDSSRLACRTQRGGVHIWDAATGRVAGSPGAGGSLPGFDGVRVGFDVTAGASSIWHVDTGRVVPLPTGESLEYSHSSINEMTKATGPDYKLSPDARKFLYRNSHMFRVWDAETGVILAGATGSGGFRQCTVSPDWSKILTIDMEDNLRIWHITTDSPDDTARRRLELEVRSATTLHADGSLSILPEAEWEQKRRQWQDLPKRPGN